MLPLVLVPLAAMCPLATLSTRAVALRTTWGLGSTLPASPLAFASEFAAGTEADTPRGWANWLLPGRLMAGQYPSVQPEVPGPTVDEANQHLARLIAAGIDGFVSLQAEVPPQDASESWPAGGVPLAGASARRFPGAFRRYGGEAARIAAEQSAAEPRMYHCPIEDLSVPSDAERLLRLLDTCLAHWEGGGSALYVHCWGGRGRAGLVGSALLALMYPGLEGDSILAHVQRGYDSRAGADSMPAALRASPQTEAQRQFVRAYARDVRASRLSDLGVL